MTPGELESLRNEVVKLQALVSASADMCSAVEGNDPKLERAQALIGLAEKQGEQLLRRMDLAVAPRLAVVQ